MSAANTVNSTAQILAGTLSPEARVGWINPPNQRGTTDILYANSVVLFVSVWAVLHPNIPARSDNYWRVMRSKALWAFLGVTSPEILTLFALSQWNAAKESVAEMRELGQHNWSIVHAFYANSGGFLLDAPDYPPFPINSKSVHYLRSHGWIELPKISKDDIWDRSKADFFAKGFSLIQAGWLLLQTVARAVKGLAITPLELFTIATAFFWINKPQNVAGSTTISMAQPIAEVLRSAGEAAKEPWTDTPMDFIEKPCWQGWMRRSSLQHFGGLERRPLERIPDDYVGPPSAGQSIVIWIVSVLHAAVHMAGWSFAFPTAIETVIWRAASLSLLFYMITGGVVPVLSTKPWFDFKFTLLFIWVRDVKNPEPTWMQTNLLNLVSGVGYVVYIIARILILVEICISFRSMPASAYVAVEWSAFLPHVN